MTHPRRRLLGAVLLMAIAAVLVAPSAGAEATRPRLRESDPYAIIADQSITSSGATRIAGNVAIAVSETITGFPPGQITGETHFADDEAIAAEGDTAAVNQNLKGQPCNSDRTGEDQGGLRLGGAVYCYIDGATLDGELRLDALSDPDTVWVFQVHGTYDVADGASVILANGAQACNVFWQVDGSVTIGAGVTMKGTIVTDESVVLEEGATLDGRIFAPQGGVQLHANDITETACAAGTDQVTTTTSTTAAPSTTTSTTPPVATTTPGSGDGTGGTGNGTDGTGSGTGDGTGSGDDGGLALTGPASMALAVLAAGALGIGYSMVGTERVVAWNARRWRPRHAAPRFERLRRFFS
jgi:hypothetical protein